MIYHSSTWLCLQIGRPKIMFFLLCVRVIFYTMSPLKQPQLWIYNFFSDKPRCQIKLVIYIPIAITTHKISHHLSALALFFMAFHFRQVARCPAMLLTCRCGYRENKLNDKWGIILIMVMVCFLNNPSVLFLCSNIPPIFRI